MNTWTLLHQSRRRIGGGDGIRRYNMRHAGILVPGGAGDWKSAASFLNHKWAVVASGALGVVAWPKAHRAGM
eukprot:1150964-Pelagomonas_calceolata.AAC.7